MFPDIKRATNQISAQIAILTNARATPLVVAVDGRSGSGKSTLANAMATKLNAVLISGDDFYAGGTMLRAEPPEILAGLCIDWRKLRDILKTLINGQSAEYYPFGWDAFDGSLSGNVIKLLPRPVIILEGVYSARPELRDVVDFTVLVELADDVRMQRLLAREGQISDWERQWHGAEDWYFDNAVSVADFDQVIDLTP